MPEEKPPVNFSDINNSEIHTGDITVTQTAGGDLVGRDKVTYFQTIIHYLPLPFMIAIGLVVVVILGVGVANLRVGFIAIATPTPTLTPIPVPSPTPTPLPFPPAAKDETLIVIARFHRTEGVMDIAAHNEIRRAIQQAAAQLKLANFRVEVEPASLTTEVESEGRALGQRYDASMVIWGADTGVRVVVNYLNLKESDFDAAKVTINKTERTLVANPDAYGKFITSDLPAQLTFLALFAVGQSFYGREDYPEAARIIEEATDFLLSEIPPPQGAANAYFRLGWLHNKIGKLGQALVDYNKAIELEPNYAAAYNNRGNVYYYQAQYEKALVDYNKAIELEPNYAAAYNNRGNVYYSQAQYEKALADFNKAIELEPNEAAAYSNRGNVYLNQAQYEEALADFNKAAVSYKNLKKYEQALADYTKIIELDPNYPDAHNELCWFGSLLGRAAEVMGRCERAVQLASDDQKAVYRDSRGVARALTGDGKGAIEDFEFFVEWMKRNDPELYEQYGSQREAWIAELKAGRNPFDEVTLEALLEE